MCFLDGRKCTQVLNGKTCQLDEAFLLKRNQNRESNCANHPTYLPSEMDFSFLLCGSSLCLFFLSFFFFFNYFCLLLSILFILIPSLHLFCLFLFHSSLSFKILLTGRFQQFSISAFVFVLIFISYFTL